MTFWDWSDRHPVLFMTMNVTVLLISFAFAQAWATRGPRR